MYLQLGGSTVIKKDSVVGVFDMDTATASKWTRKTLSEADNSGQVFETGDGLPRSFVLTITRFGQQIYLTGLSTQTIKQRSEEDLGFKI